MGFSRNKAPITMGERQRAIQADLTQRSYAKGGEVNEGMLGAINMEEFSFTNKSDIPNEAVIASAQRASGSGGILIPTASSGTTGDPEIDAIVNKAKQRLSTVASSYSDKLVERGAVKSEIFAGKQDEPTIAMNKTAMKDNLEKTKANLILRRNAKLKEMEWSQNKLIKVEVADMNREIKKIDSQLQGL